MPTKTKPVNYFESDQHYLDHAKPVYRTSEVEFGISAVVRYDNGERVVEPICEDCFNHAVLKPLGLETFPECEPKLN